jgi:hypothetical protein
LSICVYICERVSGITVAAISNSSPLKREAWTWTGRKLSLLAEHEAITRQGAVSIVRFLLSLHECRKRKRFRNRIRRARFPVAKKKKITSRISVTITVI